MISCVGQTAGLMRSGTRLSHSAERRRRSSAGRRAVVRPCKHRTRPDPRNVCSRVMWRKDYSIGERAMCRGSSPAGAPTRTRATTWQAVSERDIYASASAVLRRMCDGKPRLVFTLMACNATSSGESSLAGLWVTRFKRTWKYCRSSIRKCAVSALRHSHSLRKAATLTVAAA